MHRFLPSLLIAAAVLVAAPAIAQNQPATGIALSLADWLEPWEEAGGGGWMAVETGQPATGATVVTGRTAALAPGVYDLYWLQNTSLAPLLIAGNVTVAEGNVTDVRVTTGAILETAAWVEARHPEHGWFGAILPTATTFDFVNVTRTGTTMFLPAGEYDFYFMQDETLGLPAIWMGTYVVESPFGGLGIEVSAEDDGNIVVVRALPGGPAERGGVLAGDILTAIDGAPLTGLALADAVALLRGPPESDAVLTVTRGKNVLDLSITRNVLEPSRIIRADNGIRLILPAGTTIEPDGWWGIVFAGDSVDRLINRSTGTAGRPLLVGLPVSYDIYWNPDGKGDAELIAADVDVVGELVENTAPAPAK
jgi:hypothetical protein